MRPDDQRFDFARMGRASLLPGIDYVLDRLKEMMAELEGFRSAVLGGAPLMHEADQKFSLPAKKVPPVKALLPAPQIDDSKAHQPPARINKKWTLYGMAGELGLTISGVSQRLAKLGLKGKKATPPGGGHLLVVYPASALAAIRKTTVRGRHTTPTTPEVKIEKPKQSVLKHYVSPNVPDRVGELWTLHGIARQLGTDKLSKVNSQIRRLNLHTKVEHVPAPGKRTKVAAYPAKVLEALRGHVNGTLESKTELKVWQKGHPRHDEWREKMRRIGKEKFAAMTPEQKAARLEAMRAGRERKAA